MNIEIDDRNFNSVENIKLNKIKSGLDFFYDSSLGLDVVDSGKTYTTDLKNGRRFTQDFIMNDAVSPGQFDTDKDLFFITDVHSPPLKIVKNSDKMYHDKKLMTVEIDGIKYRALTVASRGIFESHLNFGQSFVFKAFDEISEKYPNIFEWLFNYYEDFSKIIEEEKCLVKAGGDGYKGAFKEEKFDIYKKVDCELRDFLFDEFSKIADNSYFKYNESVIEDLSISQGVSIYHWERYFINQDIYFRFSDYSFMSWIKYCKKDSQEWMSFHDFIVKAKDEVLLSELRD